MAVRHSAYEELCAGYALAALEPYEMQMFLGHLPQCLLCRTALAAYAGVAGELPYAVPPASLPASLLANIRQAIRVAALQPLTTSVVAVLPRRRRPSPGRAALWLAAAAAVALVGSLAQTNIGLRAERDAAQQASVRLSSTVSQLVVHRRVLLRSPDGSLRGVALVGAGEVSLVLHGLPINDRKSATYTLMRRSASGSMQRVGTFNVEDNALAQVDQLPLPDAGSISSLVIMLNAQPASPAAPGGAMLAVGQLS